jgi:hypothetical protein
VLSRLPAASFSGGKALVNYLLSLPPTGKSQPEVTYLLTSDGAQVLCANPNLQYPRCYMTVDV